MKYKLLLIIALTLLFVPIVFGASTSFDDFIAGYNMSSVNGYNTSYTPLTNTNTVTFGNDSTVGQTGIFTASSSNYLKYSSNLGITSGAMTIALWAKVPAQRGQTYVSHSGNTGAIVTYVGFTNYSTFWVDRSRNGIADDNLFYNVNVSDNVWHHFVYTYDGTNMIIYIDGVNVTNRVSTGTGSVPYTAGLWISSQLSSSNFVTGNLSNVYIYNRALTSVEVKNMANLSVTNPTFPFNRTTVPPPNSFTFYNTTNVNTSYTYSTTPTFTINATNASNWNITLYVNTTPSGTAYNVNSTYIANTTWSAVLNTPLTVGREYQWWFTANSNATNHINSSKYNIFVAGTYPTLSGFFIANQCSVTSSNGGYYIQ